jgi:hypothetical protein
MQRQSGQGGQGGLGSGGQVDAGEPDGPAAPPRLGRGAHGTRAGGMCAMEMVAWLAGEAHSDEPECACPVIAAFVRALNDALPTDAARERTLRPLVGALVDTRGQQHDEHRRGFRIADAAVRTFAPHLLRKRGRLAEAAALAVLPEIVDVPSARIALRAVVAFAGELHAGRWLLQRAIEGAPPARWVAAAVLVVRRAGDPEAWALAAAVAADLAAPAGPATARDRRA